MKKGLFLILTIILVLTGCGTDEEKSGSFYQLPDLNGYTLDEIEELFNSRDREFSIVYETIEDEDLEHQFSMYIGSNTGDIVTTEDDITIKVYPEFTGERTFIRLPDLRTLNEDEIEVLFEEYDVSISFSETLYVHSDKIAGTFYAYSDGKIAGEKFFLTSALGIILYKQMDDLNQYFFPLEMEYDGPLLDESFGDIGYIDPRGGYFDVTLSYCTDGDTAVFNYPQDIYDLITSGAKSSRFLNMDTEETYNGGEEEWGKPASVYTCELLTSAEAIRIQTDPGDALTGTYGRLLAWIWVKLPGEEEYFLLNYMVVRQGLAQVKYEFGAGETISYGDYTYNEWMHIAEDYAKANSIGQWGNLLDYYWDYEENLPDYDRWYND